MNIVVIGLGSMGKRRIRLLKELYPNLTIIGVDLRDDRRKEVSDQFKISCVKNIDDIQYKDKVNAAFICTSPLSHSSIINICLQNYWHVFTELNLVTDGYEHNMRLAKENKCCLFLSSTFFYFVEIKYIKNEVSTTNGWNYIYHISQYLPDWHPWENYKDFFISKKRTNACREIMAIELPWLIATFGKIVNYNVVSNKMSNLDIEYNDNYLLILLHENGNKGTLIIDVVSPIAERFLEVYTENKYIKWNGTPESLTAFDIETRKLRKIKLLESAERINGYDSFIVETAHKNAIIEFFKVINGKSAQYGFEEDFNTLNLINEIER